tara:strand:- start:4535 stop:4825 length:291 start_codon:yes stop_codon:yes gene_type:complete
MEETTNIPLPSQKALNHAFKLAAGEDRPIMCDYYADSLEKKCMIGVREDSEKLLVKSEDEYTSPISKIFKVENEFIVLTENSLYIVSKDIPTCRVS